MRNDLQLATSCLVALALTLVAGCSPPSDPGTSVGSSGPPPVHPAMRDPNVARAASVPDPHAGMGDDLPPGHPPIASAAATPGATGAEAPTASAPATSDLASRLADFGVALDIPAGWKPAAGKSSMRLATFLLEKADGASSDAEVSLIPAMGSEQQNIDRWRGQFQENPPATTSSRDSGGVKVTVSQMEGTFTGAGSPQPGTRLWGAILRVPGQDNLLFFKAWGPVATMERWEASFESLVSSVKLAR